MDSMNAGRAGRWYRIATTVRALAVVGVLWGLGVGMDAQASEVEHARALIASVPLPPSLEVRGRFAGSDSNASQAGAEYSVERTPGAFKMHVWSLPPGMEPLLEYVIADDGVHGSTFQAKRRMIERGKSQLDTGVSPGQEACVSPAGWVRGAIVRLDRGDEVHVASRDGVAEISLKGAKDELTLRIGESDRRLLEVERDAPTSGMHWLYAYQDWAPIDGAPGFQAPRHVKQTLRIERRDTNRTDVREYAVTSVRLLGDDVNVGEMPQPPDTILKDVATGMMYGPGGAELKPRDHRAHSGVSYVWISGGVVLCIGAGFIWRVRRRAEGAMA